MGPPTIRSTTNWTPIPRYSICPFCGGKHERFSEANFKASVNTLVAFIVTLGVVFLLLNTCSHAPEKKSANVPHSPPAQSAELKENARVSGIWCKADFT